MNIQMFGLMQFVVASLVLFIGIKVYPKSHKTAIAIVLTIPLMFIFTPVVFKQESFSQLERSQESVYEQELPPRVMVEKEDYSLIDKNQSKQLKAESKELLNEILN